MGENAKFQGETIKIGTCESMYYLRADQAHLVTALRGNVDPIGDAEAIRFRFPWPDEDGVLPGAFKNHERAIGLFDVKAPTLSEVDHRSIQFQNGRGYLLTVACPESGEEGAGSDHGLTFHRNGWGGAVKICEQAWRGGKLVTIAECGGCGAKYRLSTIEDARPYIASLIKTAEEHEHRERVRPKFDACRDGVGPTEESIARAGEFYRKVAARIEAGYAATPPTSAPPKRYTGEEATQLEPGEAARIMAPFVSGKRNILDCEEAPPTRRPRASLRGAK